MFRDNTTFLAGPSPAIARLNGQIRYVAPYFRTALLTGERDCGEASAVRLLHQLSPLAHRPFLEITADDAQLRFEQIIAQSSPSTEGMIYLPHPEELCAAAQKALLRLLRDRGPQSPRVVAFAENGVRSLVSTGTFSTELADTLASLRIPLPPLRDRPEDIPGLLTKMLHDQAALQSLHPPALSSELLEYSATQPWPGNFDELATVVLTLLKRPAAEPLGAADLQAALVAIPTPPIHDRRKIRLVSLDRVIQEHIHTVLFACKGNKLRAAEVLGISRSTLYRMLGASSPDPVTDADTPAQDPTFSNLRIAS
jgi:two-component system response regulator HydG